MVLTSVLGGFLLEGGKFLVLMQWAEFVIIGGAAAGAILISTPKATLTQLRNQEDPMDFQNRLVSIIVRFQDGSKPKPLKLPSCTPLR